VGSKEKKLLFGKFSDKTSDLLGLDKRILEAFKNRPKAFKVLQASEMMRVPSHLGSMRGSK
jgi:hypothetical protein